MHKCCKKMTTRTSNDFDFTCLFIKICTPSFHSSILYSILSKIQAKVRSINLPVSNKKTHVMPYKLKCLK